MSTECYSEKCLLSQSLNEQLLSSVLELSNNRTTEHCLFSYIIPNNLTATTTPLIAWVIIVLYATMNTVKKNLLVEELSIKKSFNELLTIRNTPLAILDIFRVLAIIWVMINHTGSEGRIDILDRLSSAEQFKKSIHEHPVFGAFLGNSALGVEIFLVLSGLLAAISWMQKSNEPFWPHYSKFILHRCFRLLPSIGVFVFIASGPLMKALLPRFHSTMISTCGFSGITSHLTFLGNWQLTPTCMGYLWYLGLDMQLQLLAPFLLHKLYKSQKVGILIGMIAVITSSAIRAIYCLSYGVCNKSDVDIPFISYPNQDPKSLAKIYAGLWEMYARPYTKCGPFIIGLLTGYFISQVRNVQFNKKKSRHLFLLSLALAIATIYAILPEYWYPNQGNTTYNTLYTALFRTVFATSIALMIVAMVYNKQRLTVHPLWTILARLTFGAYLFHMPIVYIFNYVQFLQQATTPYHLIAVIPFVALLSFMVSMIFYIFVESPFGRISRRLLSQLL
uniref:Acyl_transf_3 domain-containing protein n=1 Tax=Syphacia muris TaxID=451379 RepID=A0A0N5AKR8_9BILA